MLGGNAGAPVAYTISKSYMLQGAQFDAHVAYRISKSYMLRGSKLDRSCLALSSAVCWIPGADVLSSVGCWIAGRIPESGGRAALLQRGKIHGCLACSALLQCGKISGCLACWAQTVAERHCDHALLPANAVPLCCYSVRFGKIRFVSIHFRFVSLRFRSHLPSDSKFLSWMAV